MNSKTKNKINSSSFSYQPSKVSDIPQIIDIIQGFEYPFDSDHYKWKYLDCPWGSISVTCKSGTDIIGHAGNSIRPYLINNKNALIGLNSDGIVHNEYRRKGILLKIEDICQKEAVNKDVHYFFSFPNHITFPYTIKYGYDFIGYVPLYLKILNMKKVINLFSESAILPHFNGIFSFLFRSKKITSPQTIETREVTHYPDSLDLLWDKVISDSTRQFQNIGLRTKKYLEWRFRSCPDRKYRFIIANDIEGNLRGYMVLRELDVKSLKEGAIIDIFHAPNDKEVSTALISYAHEHFINADVDLIACLLSDTKTCIPQVLRKFGFMRFLKRFNPRPWPAVILKIPICNENFSITNQREWYLTWADNDVF